LSMRLSFVLYPPLSSSVVALFPYTTQFRSVLALVDQLVCLRVQGGALRRVLGRGAGWLRRCGLRLSRSRSRSSASCSPRTWTCRSEEHSLNSSHLGISHAVFCLKKKKKKK